MDHLFPRIDCSFGEKGRQFNGYRREKQELFICWRWWCVSSGGRLKLPFCDLVVFYFPLFVSILFYAMVNIGNDDDQDDYFHVHSVNC